MRTEAILTGRRKKAKKTAREVKLQVELDKTKRKMSKLMLTYEEQAARIKVLEKALIKSNDYEKLLKERGTTANNAWQEWDSGER